MELREKIADQAHKSWSGWMEYLFSKSVNIEGSITIPKELAEKWLRQMKTDYEDLTEKEKESDRKEADDYCDIMCKHIASHMKRK